MLYLILFPFFSTIKLNLKTYKNSYFNFLIYSTFHFKNFTFNYASEILVVVADTELCSNSSSSSSSSSSNGSCSSSCSNSNS